MLAGHNGICVSCALEGEQGGTTWGDDMSIQIELKPEIEAEAKPRAQRDGLLVSQYVQRILEQHLSVQTTESIMTPEERAKALEEWAENFPYRRSTPLSDEAISREGIYRRD